MNLAWSGGNLQCESRKSTPSSVPAFKSLFFPFQVSNVFLPPGLQCLASTGSHHSVLWLAGWEHPFSGVCLGREEFCHPAHSGGAAAARPTLHSNLQGKFSSTLTMCVSVQRENAVLKSLEARKNIGPLILGLSGCYLLEINLCPEWKTHFTWVVLCGVEYGITLILSPISFRMLFRGVD